MTCEMPPDDRESLGRLVRETWVAYVRKQVKDPKPSWTAPWDDLDDFQREVDMRIGHAVASYALTENAATYDLACPRCAGFLDRAYDEHERAEAAEAKLAGLRAVLLEGGQDAATARRRALAVIGSEEEAGRGGDYDVWGADFGTVGGKG